MVNRNKANEKVQKSFDYNRANPSKQESETFHANLAIQNRFYGDKKVEDDIDTSLSMNSNIGAVLLPEDKEE